MASRRRNIKTHPKPTGDDAPPDNFMPPDRSDRDTGADSGRTEVVDVFGKDETVTGEGEVGGGDIDLNSAGEGDARSMSSEEGGNARGDTDAGNGSGDDRRGRGDVRRARSGDGVGADEGEGGDSYSARVRKRIARERTLVNRERALREQTQRELAEERAARVAQDERIARLERAQTDIAGNAGVKELEAKIAGLRPQLAAALEAGETAKVLDLQDQLANAVADLKVLKYDLQQKQKAAEAQSSARQQQRTQSTGAVIDDPAVAELAAQFQKANRHWWNRTANKDAKQDAITIDKEILGEISAGELDFQPYSDEHFEEMARRLHETYPDLEIQDLDGQPYNFDDDNEEGMNERNTGRDNRGGRGPQAAARGAPVNRMGQNGRRAPNEVDLARQGKVTLDQHDFATMRLFKMDPNNAEHKKYFAKEKMRSIITGDRRAGGNR